MFAYQQYRDASASNFVKQFIKLGNSHFGSAMCFYLCFSASRQSDEGKLCNYVGIGKSEAQQEIAVD